MNIDDLLKESIDVKFLRTWREQAYQRGVKRLETHLQTCNATHNDPSVSVYDWDYCKLFPTMQKEFDDEMKEWDDKLKEYRNK